MKSGNEQFALEDKGSGVNHDTMTPRAESTSLYKQKVDDAPSHSDIQEPSQEEKL